MNEAIERAHRDGILSTASLMVAGAAAADAVQRARRNPALRVGLHLVVVEGPAVLPPDRIPALVGMDGQFPPGQSGMGQARMGWRFPWASSHGSDFNYDYHVSWTPEQLASGRIFYNFAEEGIAVRDDGTESPGMSAFFKDADGTVYHTYSAYARGIEDWIGTLMILDRAPRGRNEDATMNFVRRHDEYEGATAKAACH